MALDDRQHVEAVAIMRRLADASGCWPPDAEAADAARIWLKENHPAPEVYIAAMTASADQRGPDA